MSRLTETMAVSTGAIMGAVTGPGIGAAVTVNTFRPGRRQ